jgi:hypothetical protein
MGRDSRIDRRHFVVQSAVAAGAVWSAPAIRTVRLVAAAGSNPPAEPTSTTMSTPPDLVITGGGWVEDHNRFGFNARTNANGPSGQLEYMYGAGRPTRVHSVDITGAQVDGDRATLIGSAKVDGTSGFTFRVDVVDGAPDRFAIVVFASNGSVFHQTGTPDSPLEVGGGSVQIH